MELKVLQHHIDAGRRGEIHSCAVALAVREAFPDAGKIIVGGYETGDVKIDNRRYRGASVLGCWLRDFDQGAPVLPGTFTLTEVPDAS